MTNERRDSLDGAQRWFYGGEPGGDDLPPDEGPVGQAQAVQAHEERPVAARTAERGSWLCSACARAQRQRRPLWH